MHVHSEMETEGLTPAWNTPALCRLYGGACGVPASPGCQRPPPEQCWWLVLGAWGQCCAVLWVGAWRGAGLSGWAWPHMSSSGRGSEQDAVCSGPGRQRCVFVFRAIFHMAFVLLVKRFRR